MRNGVYFFAAFACFFNIDATVKVGRPVPDFRLPDQAGRVHYNVSQWRGSKVALIFYPNDSVPYCRLEAEALRNEFIKLQDAGVVVIGINTESQKGVDLKNRLRIPFPLLTADKKLLKSFGVDDWFGKVKRKTFLIDENGILVKIIDDVKLRKHHEQILSGFGLTKSNS